MEGTEDARRRHRIIYVVTILLVLIVVNIFAVIIYSVFSVPIIASDSERFYLNEACNVTAQRFLNNMNPLIDPCNNFYQFTCGGYVSRAVIPEGKGKTLISDELETKVQKKLKDLLENLNSQMNYLPLPYRYLGHLYSLCMGQEDATGVEEARKLFQDVGGWSIIDNSSSLPGNWTFQETERKLRSVSLDGSSLLKINADYNSSTIIFVVRKPDLALPASVLVKGLKAPAVQSYYQYMVDMARLYGTSSDEANVTMTDTLDFEIELASLIESRKAYVFSTNYTLDQLSKFSSTNWISWSDMLKSLVPDSIPITENQTVYIEDPEYIDKLNTFLSVRKSRVVADYMMWRSADGMAPYVSEALRKRRGQHLGEGALPRWSHCLQILSSKMDTALSSLYIKNYVEKGVKQAAEGLVLNIREEIIDNVDHLRGLNEASKTDLKQNISRITLDVAYPSELDDVEKLEYYYQNLTMNKDSFLLAFLEVSKWERDIRMNRSLSINSSLHWTNFEDVLSPSATFSEKEKSISVKVGLLQPPVFSPKLPLFITYGSIGYIVAHNIIHTLENQATNNKEGDNKIKYKDALKLAYRAYRKCAEQLEKPEAMLPGLHQYSNDQMFMISMANLLCTKYGSDRRDNDGKSPIEKKVNGVVNRSEDFNRAFNCNST